MQTVLIAGGSGGVAQALANRLGNRWRVVLVTRHPELIEAAPGVAIINADLSTEAGAAEAFSECVRVAGSPAAFINAAGNTLLQPIARTSTQQMRDVFQANFDTSWFGLKEFVGLRRKEGGSVVLFSSIVARIGVANHEAIGAAKAAVEGLARSAAATYASAGIRVNVIAPGLTDTRMAQPLTGNPVFREAAAKQYPLGGIGEADELASLADWLISPESARVTGQIIGVDGGFASIRPLVK
ncbi:MAG: SDR family oxidoreductase [Ahniella sp.]|nr:SDR family oxidoreductase [Ahniella sp.]